MRLTVLPADILANVFAQLRECSAPRAFAADVRRLALVSRATGEMVERYAASPAAQGLADEWAVYANRFQAARLRQALNAAAAQKSRKKLGGLGGTKLPPKALKELVRQHDRIALSLPCDGDERDRKLFDALVRWGCRLPLAGLKITADAGTAPVQPTSGQHVAHLVMLIELLKTLGNHPHRERIRVTLHLKGNGFAPSSDQVFFAHADGVIWQFFRMLALSNVVTELRLENVFLWHRLCPNLWSMSSLSTLHVMEAVPLRTDAVNDLLEAVPNAEALEALTLGPVQPSDGTRERLESLQRAKPTLVLRLT